MYNIEAQLERRHVLRSAALVCREWARLAQTLLSETVIFRKLVDVDVVGAAVASGHLDVDLVRVIYVDAAAGGIDSADRHDTEEAWRIVAYKHVAERLGAVDRTDAACVEEMRTARWSDEDARPLLVQGAGRFAALLPEFERAAFSSAEMLAHVHVPAWSTDNLLIGRFDNCWWDDWSLRAGFSDVLGGWTDLRNLSVLDVEERSAEGQVYLLSFIPYARLRCLRVGCFSRRGGLAIAGDQARIVTEPAPHLTELSLYIDYSPDDEQTEAWPAALVGPVDGPHFLPVLETLTIGLPVDQIDAGDILAITGGLARSTSSFTLAIGPIRSAAAGVDSVLVALAKAIKAAGDVVLGDLRTFAVDLRWAEGVGGWQTMLASDAWTALQDMLELCGVDAVLVL